MRSHRSFPSPSRINGGCYILQKFEDTKGVIRSRNSKKESQCHLQLKKDGQWSKFTTQIIKYWEKWSPEWIRVPLSVLFQLEMTLTFLLRIAASDYSFGIFKLLQYVTTTVQSYSRRFYKQINKCVIYVMTENKLIFIKVSSFEILTSKPPSN
jgi:hypothetical protein